MSKNKDIGETLEVTSALDQQGFPSALGADVERNVVDRKDKDWPRSMVLYADFSNQFTDSGDKLTFTVQESSDDSTYTDTSDTIVVSSGSASEKAEADVQLSDKERYIRLQLDVDDPNDQSLAADATGSVTAVLGGQKVLPQ